VGGGIQQREHGVEVDQVAVKAVTMRTGEAGQLGGRGLDGGVFEGQYFHLIGIQYIVFVKSNFPAVISTGRAIIGTTPGGAQMKR